MVPEPDAVEPPVTEPDPSTRAPVPGAPLWTAASSDAVAGSSNVDVWAGGGAAVAVLVRTDELEWAYAGPDAAPDVKPAPEPATPDVELVATPAPEAATLPEDAVETTLIPRVVDWGPPPPAPVVEPEPEASQDVELVETPEPTPDVEPVETPAPTLDVELVETPAPTLDVEPVETPAPTAETAPDAEDTPDAWEPAEGPDAPVVVRSLDALWGPPPPAPEAPAPVEEPAAEVVTDVEEPWADWEAGEPDTRSPAAAATSEVPTVVRSLDALWGWAPSGAETTEPPAPAAETTPDAEPVETPGAAEPAGVEEQPWVEWEASASDGGSTTTETAPGDVPAVVRSADAIWAWIPDAPPAPPAPPAVVAPTAPVKKRRGKKAPSPVIVPETKTESPTPPAPVVAPAPVKKRRGKKVAPSVVETEPHAKIAPLAKSEPQTKTKTKTKVKEVPAPVTRTEVETIPRKHQRLKTAAVAGLIAVCAAMPFLMPQIPDLFAKAVPEPAPSVFPSDPPVDPITSGPQDPVTRDPSLVGVRLGSAGKPLEVWVPRLHVRSPVVPISGQTGELIPPDNPQELGWWQEGREVGAAEGSSVVTGHTVSTGGGAFDHLGELVPGDRIRVRTSAGEILYVVEKSRDVSVEKLAKTAEEIFRQTGPGRLVLITCSDFNGSVYLSNSVVYAVPVKDEPKKKGPTATP